MYKEAKNKAVKPQENKEVRMENEKPLQEWFFPADGRFPATTIRAHTIEEATELYTKQRSANVI